MFKHKMDATPSFGVTMIPEVPSNPQFTLSKIVVQTNFPRIDKTYIFRPGRKSTFTWTMPYKSIPVLVIT